MRGGDMIKWGRSQEGYVTSKCGRFEISPKFWGNANPTGYELTFCSQKIGDFEYETQAQAKEEAESFCMHNDINTEASDD